MSDKRRITGDLLLYSAGMAVPMLVLFIRMPIYTRVFSPEVFGQFAIVNVTFTYLSTMAFRTLMNIGSRFFHSYKQKGLDNTYYRAYYQLVIISVVLITAVSAIWFVLSDQAIIRSLIFWGLLHFIFQELVTTLTLPLRQEKKAVLVNTIRIIAAVASFAILLVLTFIFELNIASFYICTIGVNIILLIYLLVGGHLKIPHKVFVFEKQSVKEFIRYGFSDISLSIGVLLIVNSDRYIIDFFWTKADVGSYSLIYNLGQMLVMTAVTLFQTATNPHMYELIEKNNNTFSRIIPRFLYPAVYLYIPFTLVGVFFAKDLSLILGPNFRQLYYILPWVVGASFIYGLTHFFLLPLRFTNRYSIIIKGSLLAAGLNIGLNLILVKHYGPEGAAWTTLVANLTLFIAYASKSSLRLSHFTSQKLLWMKMLLSLVLISTLYVLYKICFDNGNILATVTMLVLIGVIYLSINHPKKAISILNHDDEN